MTIAGRTSASLLNPSLDQIVRTVEQERPRPLRTLLASAKRLTSADLNKNQRSTFGATADWQEDAWEMYDLVGEQHFLSKTLAGRMAQARLFVGLVSEDPLEPPEPLDVEEDLGAKVFSFFGGSQSGRTMMVERLGVNLFVAGDGWLVGIPQHVLEKTPKAEERELVLDDMEWKMLSVSEVDIQQDKVVLQVAEGEDGKLKASPDDLFMIRVWRPHPRKFWEADSPTRASLPVLRELVSLTMHISAQIDSRLAGAGVFIVPQSAQRAIAVAAGLDPDTEEDPFTEALMEAMMTPIGDRSSAAAVVPLVVTVPDESTGLFQHISFANNLDNEARNLRDEAIRRLALGQDAPPELLLGTGGMNHWGAWLVREDVVTTHLEPPLALICDALTTQFLWPVLEAQGMSPAEARRRVVWYDVAHMVQRPNRLGDAITLYNLGELHADTLREAANFSDSDKPAQRDEAIDIAVQLAKANPALIDNMKEIIAAFNEVLTNPNAVLPDPDAVSEVDLTESDAGEEEAPVEDEGTEEGPPDQASGPSSLPPRTSTTATRMDTPMGAYIHLSTEQPCPENCHYCALDWGQAKERD